jgi:hypothetical protein
VERIWFSIHSPNTILQLIFVSLFGLDVEVTPTHTNTEPFSSNTNFASSFMLGFSFRLQTYHDLAGTWLLTSLSVYQLFVGKNIGRKNTTHAGTHRDAHTYPLFSSMCTYWKSTVDMHIIFSHAQIHAYWQIYILCSMYIDT